VSVVIRRLFVALVFVPVAIVAVACSSPTAPSPDLEGGVVATFDAVGDTFTVFVKNPVAVQRLLQLRDGANLGQIPNGRILRGPGAGNHNAPHAWHLDPDDIEIVDLATEVCDGAPSYVDANVAEYVDVIGRYCPWGAQLVRLDDYR
jgi:hypothetical protein